MTAPQKTHYADDETLEYIAELEQRNALWESVYSASNERCIALELSARKSAEEAEELKAALRYYADSENYKPHVLECGDMVIIPVCDDRGEIARQSLKERAT